MSTLFWIGIVLHVFLCLFLVLLVLVQNDKMGGLAGLGGMTSQSAFSTAGAATFIQKLTRAVAILFFLVVLALGLIASRQSSQGVVSELRQSATETAAPAASGEPGQINPGDFAPETEVQTIPIEAPAPATEVQTIPIEAPAPAE